MKPRIQLPSTIPSLSPCQRKSPSTFTQRSIGSIQIRRNNAIKTAQIRAFSITHRLRLRTQPEAPYNNSNARPAEELNHNITEEEKEDYNRRIAEDKGKQIRTPWHREGSDKPPVATQRSAGAMTKGKLLTTPSRMLKLILPLTTKDENTDRKDVEPLALLVHPQQPLSYLERLIQSELPTLKTEKGEKIPSVFFRAEDSVQDSMQPSEPRNTTVPDSSKMPDQKHEKSETEDKDSNENKVPEEEQSLDKADEMYIDGKLEKTGKLTGKMNRRTPNEAAQLRGGHGEGGVESYSGLGHEAPSDQEAPRKFVRWSSSTEIGDFIRDAARGQEFAVEIEGAPNEIRVGVPSFNDRTYYLRMRLRKTSKNISSMAEIKKVCDELAHKGAQRVAMGGFGILCGWWYLVYRLTFETDLGWDVMEPVTYLVGLSTLIGGYVWFLYHNREVSYRSALNFTISRRQSKLYHDKGFDLRKWESLVEEGNALRKEIKAVANEYDVEWDELADEQDKEVSKALRRDREKKKGNKKDDKKDDSSDGEEDVK